MADNTAPSSANDDIVTKLKAFIADKNGTPATSATPVAEKTADPVIKGNPTQQSVPINTLKLDKGTTSSPAKAADGTTSVRGMTNLVDALFTKGVINDETLRAVKFESITTGKSPAQILQAKNLVTEADIQKAKAEMYGLNFVDLASVTIDNQVLNKIPAEAASRNQVIAFEETNNRLKVAMFDPLDLQKINFIESLVGKKVDAYYATTEAIQRVIDTKYGAQIGKEVDRALEDVGVVDLARESQVADLSTGSIDSAPVSKIVNMILDYAVKHHASDVHIEPRETRIVVRYRVHGILSEKLSLPPRLGPAIISRIKILANMKIDEHRVPQDNRFQVKTSDKIVDIRVSVMPAIYGEKVVMRLLEKGGAALTLEATGLRGPAFKVYSENLHKTQGIILITGPTGSGKTQTLASSLAILNKQEVNIVTIEDPVEIRIDGITQVQVNPEVGLTFATGLRSFLRQDPDIIMVGEIRDTETANLAVQAALTGHLVLATLHTNSAAGALPRLLDMGVQPFLISSTINLIVGQRLVRRLCDDCKQAYIAEPHIVEMLHRTLDGLHGFDLYTFPKSEKVHFDSHTDKVTLYRPVGCPKCGDTGYSGRLGIFEVMPMSDKIGQMIMSHLSANDINAQAVSEGMISMVQDGYIKAIEGITTIEEVMRVQNV
jgi:type IV pilus assembly protein PilB